MPLKHGTELTRRSLIAGLRLRREEIGQAVVTRVHAIEPPTRGGDLGYLEGLRAAIEAGIEYSIEALEGDEDRPEPVPGAILNQASLAARSGVSQETVLRRYLAGHAVLCDFVIEEAERQSVPARTLRSGLRSQAARTDRVLAAVSAAYVQAAGATRPLSANRRRVERVRRLLDGELVDPADLDYDLDAWHVGVVAAGPGFRDAITRLSRSLDRRLLIVAVDDLSWWAWLGGRRGFEAAELEALQVLPLPPVTRLAFGEPGESLSGWRLSHRQALAAHNVAQQERQSTTRYADVALLASVMQDELLVSSLRRLYLEPLEKERDGGEVARETLKAYFGAERNISSAAAALGIDRSTVTKRLRGIEERIGNRIASCSAELSIALRLTETQT